MTVRYGSATGLLLFCIVTVSFGSPPDIVMIAIDDLRPMLGCYGDQRVKSPNIDRLARQGVVFDHAYCQYAKCGTSRLSLMTGLRPDSVGVFSNNQKDVARFRKRRPTTHSIARWLKDAGYHTQSFGKIDHDGWDSPDDWSRLKSGPLFVDVRQTGLEIDRLLGEHETFYEWGAEPGRT